MSACGASELGQFRRPQAGEQPVLRETVSVGARCRRMADEAKVSADKAKAVSQAERDARFKQNREVKVSSDEISVKAPPPMAPIPLQAEKKSSQLDKLPSRPKPSPPQPPGTAERFEAPLAMSAPPPQLTSKKQESSSGPLPIDSLIRPDGFVAPPAKAAATTQEEMDESAKWKEVRREIGVME